MTSSASRTKSRVVPPVEPFLKDISLAVRVL
jgi:hypothetical protein